MIREHDLVVLERDIDEHHLVKGDVGTVVHCYAGGDAYDVEFVTVAVLTLEKDDVRSLAEQATLRTESIFEIR